MEAIGEHDPKPTGQETDHKRPKEENAADQVVVQEGREPPADEEVVDLWEEWVGGWVKEKRIQDAEIEKEKKLTTHPPTHLPCVQPP